MSDDVPDKTDETKTDDKPESKGSVGTMSIKELADVVEDMVKRFLGNDKSSEGGADRDTEKGTNVDLERQVQDAVQKIRASEKSNEEKTSLLQTIQDLKAKVEKQPIERRRVHKFMGWGEPE